ncbi:hypothetical protein [Thermococcus gammatolerans]|uniref:Uncharacterized protein n=1 Tax=Thermococcus gammatolerans (strain DSM 15229 / JCM 11827 / EJ3) TaxID=593117 RepID=C5A4K5_THEGJ|nr:hypothetical protein [Thermococcus gammatolerans]ACS33167.1 Conserved hypothetical protein [Thermococcus gammatolerans EJ3]
MKLNMRLDVNIIRSVTILMVVVAVFIAGLAVLIGLNTREQMLLQSVLVMANVLMAAVVALQALATMDSVEQAKKQAELMNKSLMEMKKQRMNIEFMKNEIIGYISTIEASLRSNLQEHSNGRAGYEVGSYLSLDYGRHTLSLQEQGMNLRINKKIQKLIEQYNVDLEKYNELIRKINANTKEIIEKLEEDSALNARLSQVSKEIAEKSNKPEVAPKIIIPELVYQFKEDISKIEPPRFGLLGLDPKKDKRYRLELWESTKEVFLKYLQNNNIPIYNKLIERSREMEELKKMTISLSEKVERMKEELLQNEKELEERIMNL